jgi:2-dehydro-3-deoxyphosphogluconate aldolase/(4S)-4-hydroxy-2-oxoglutarate aldolase
LNRIEDAITAHKIIPVVKLRRAAAAVQISKALVSGGLPVAEITFRSEAAADSIAIIAERFPDMLLGAGTVTTTTQAEQAVSAGARFVVTPGFSRAVTEFCINSGTPIFPGICTPTELMQVLEYGIHIVKFFPSAQYGGLATIKALSAPFPQMRFMPTGGISETNIAEYLAFDRVIACGGSWMVREDLIESGGFDEIERLTARAVLLAGGKKT